jgi:hypothetical protein
MIKDDATNSVTITSSDTSPKSHSFTFSSSIDYEKFIKIFCGAGVLTEEGKAQAAAAAAARAAAALKEQPQHVVDKKAAILKNLENQAQRAQQLKANTDATMAITAFQRIQSEQQEKARLEELKKLQQQREAETAAAAAAEAEVKKTAEAKAAAKAQIVAKDKAAIKAKQEEAAKILAEQDAAAMAQQKAEKKAAALAEKKRIEELGYRINKSGSVTSYTNPHDNTTSTTKPTQSAVEMAFSGKPAERAKFIREQKKLEEAAQQKLQADLPNIDKLQTQAHDASAAAAPLHPPLASAAQQKSQSQPLLPLPTTKKDTASAIHSHAVDKGARLALERQQKKTWYNNPGWSEGNTKGIHRYYTKEGDDTDELPTDVEAVDEDLSLAGSSLGHILPGVGGKKQRQPNSKNKNKNKNKKVSIKKNKKRTTTKKTRRNKKNKNKK